MKTIRALSRSASCVSCPSLTTRRPRPPWLQRRHRQQEQSLEGHLQFVSFNMELFSNRRYTITIALPRRLTWSTEIRKNAFNYLDKFNGSLGILAVDSLGQPCLGVSRGQTDQGLDSSSGDWLRPRQVRALEIAGPELAVLLADDLAGLFAQDWNGVMWLLVGMEIFSRRRYDTPIALPLSTES